MITKHEIMMRTINLEDECNRLEERIYELELAVKNLKKPVVKKTTKK